MSSRRHTVIACVALVAWTMLAVPASAQPFNCLPSCAANDGRFLLIANGPAFQTLSDPTLDLTFIVPAGTASFQIGIFDGDVQGGTPPNLNWDTGDPGLGSFSIPVFRFIVFADPEANVSGTEVVAGPFFGSSFLSPTAGTDLPNNAWFDIPITTGPEAQTATGDYVYRLRVELLNPDTTQTANGFKVRTSEIAVLEPIAQPFGYVAQISGIPDLNIIYPSGFPGPSTYNGFFSFFIENNAPQTSVSLWDGDFDRGDFNGANSDTDDPNTPGGAFEPTWATGDTVPEGVAVGTAPSTGSPPDDNSGNPATDPFLRQPSVRYDLIGPGGRVYPNENPSGNQEWEEFKVVVTGVPTDPVDCSSPDAFRDCTTGSLPAGSYQLRIQGVDLANFNFLLTPSRVLCADENGLSCPPPSDAPRFAVGDTVFEDFSGDGVQQAGEPGIQGVIVELVSEPGGNVIDTTVTDANGNYAFTVSPGTYTVRVAGENFAAPAAGGAIGDTVWYDVDGDGFEGATEPGISNIGLRLFLDGGDGLTDGADDTVVGVTVTDLDGHYFFNGLPDGDYWVDVVNFSVPSGLSISGGTDPSAIVSIASNVVDTVDFGYENGDPLTATVGNFLWIDAGGPGLQDAGEAGIGNVTVELRDGVTNAFVAETRTGPDGAYLFTGVAPGTYVVDVTDTAGILSSAGLVPTVTGAGLPDEDSDPDPTAPFAVVAGDMILTKDFGYVNPALADITDTVWFDADRDGVFDGAESALAGVTVNLVDAQGAPIATATTNGAGTFTFADLPPGFYGLEITDLGQVLAGLLPTTAASAKNRQNVSLGATDVFGVNFGWVATGALETFTGTTIKDPVGDVDEQIDTVVAADVPTYDFGYSQFGSIGDRVWLDLNGNGIQDPGEPGINGVSISLLDGGGMLVATTTTAGDGNYTFADLLPGLYTVVIDANTLPASLAQTFDLDGLATAGAATVTLVSNQDRVDVDFGYGPCAPCDGKVTRLTLLYSGSSPAFVQVRQKKDNQQVFGAMVMPGEEFSFVGVGSKGTLTAEILVFVDGALHVIIHTSCSQPIGPGLVAGDFVVLAGASRNGGLLCPLGGGGGAPLCVPKRVRDDFDVSSFANDDGPDAWAGGWIENDPEAGGAGPSVGQVRVLRGFLKLDDQPDTGGHPSAARQVDLTGAGTATFRFDFQTTGGVDSRDAVTVEASSDGGASWTTLEVFTGIYGASAGSRSFDISSFASSQTRIRFRVSNLFGGSDEFFKVDFAEITATCPP